MLDSNMSTIKQIKRLVKKANQRPDKYSNVIDSLIMVFPTKMVSSLKQIVNGPVWDGDLISKYDRDILIECGIVFRIIYKGKPGYNATNYIGFDIVKLLTM